MAKYDEQLDRMNYLMEFDNHSKAKSSDVEYHTVGADGRVYGIIKEGTKYYIKVTAPGLEELKESYDYIGGFNEKRKNEFGSYNEATKHLEVSMINLNESYGKHEDVSTVDFKKNEKGLMTLTEEARKELDRMHQIFENSTKIGMKNVGDEESKGNASGDDTKKNNDPFSTEASASLDKDPKFNGTVKGATEHTEVGSVDADLQSDKMKTKNSGSLKDFKDTDSDLDGKSVASEHPNGGKAVMVNESCCGENDDFELDFGDEYSDDDEDFSEFGLEPDPEEKKNEINQAWEEDALNDIEFDQDRVDNGYYDNDDNDIAGLDELLEEFTSDFLNDESDEFVDSVNEEEENLSNATKSTIVGPNKVLDGESCKGVKCDTEGCELHKDACNGSEETMKNYKGKGSLPVQSWDKMNEAKKMISTIVEDVYRKLGVSKVNEETTKLDAWGKHPRYRKQPMTLPDNREVLAGTADRDFNDNSAKGNSPYGQKIGSSKPFDKVVEMLTDQVMSQLKESRRNRKR